MRDGAKSHRVPSVGETEIESARLGTEIACRVRLSLGSEAAPKKTRSLGDQIYERLKGDIIVCRFRPGDEITEIGVADLYQVGRAPVRAALARLCQERLLIAERRRGHLVAPITAKSIKDVFSMRLILEPVAARNAVGRVDVSELKGFSANPSACGASLGFLDENRAFHMAIVRACGNERLERTVSELYDEMARMLHLGLYGQKDSDHMRVDHNEQERQHKAIIDAFELKDPDPDAAEAAVRAHIESSHSLVLKSMLSGSLPFSI